MLISLAVLLSKKIWDSLTQLMMNKCLFSPLIPVLDGIQILDFDPSERRPICFNLQWLRTSQIFFVHANSTVTGLLVYTVNFFPLLCMCNSTLFLNDIICCWFSHISCIYFLPIVFYTFLVPFSMLKFYIFIWANLTLYQCVLGLHVLLNKSSCIIYNCITFPWKV